MRDLVDKAIRTKESRLCVALDVQTSEEFFSILRQIAPHIVMVKTHIDVMDIPEGIDAFVKRLQQLSKTENFLIFEDRKFAEIGKVVQWQYTRPPLRIKDWAHIITAHAVAGPGILQAIEETCSGQNDRGVLFLAQMTPRGNLCKEGYTKAAVDIGLQSPICLGFIGDGSDPQRIKELRELCGPEKMIFTPGINLDVSGDNLGQQYGHPREAIAAGADVIIVGSGICKAENPESQAKRYKEASWISQ